MGPIRNDNSSWFFFLVNTSTSNASGIACLWHFDTYAKPCMDYNVHLLYPSRVQLHFVFNTYNTSDVSLYTWSRTKLAWSRGVLSSNGIATLYKTIRTYADLYTRRTIIIALRAHDFFLTRQRTMIYVRNDNDNNTRLGFGGYECTHGKNITWYDRLRPASASKLTSRNGYNSILFYSIEIKRFFFFFFCVQSNFYRGPISRSQKTSWYWRN